MMAIWHGYFGMANLNLSAGQKATLVDELKTLGPISDPSPARLNHWRTRLDGEAAIFEAAFQDSALTIETWKNRLAAIFGVNPDTIDHAASYHEFGGHTTTVVVFSRLGTDYIRVALFGGVGADWDESGDECRGYLALYRDQWETE